MSDFSDSERAVTEAAEKLRAALGRDARIDMNANSINVNARNGEILLTGTAENIIAKRLAANYAAQFAEQIPVRDELRVATSPVEDRALRDALALQLQGERVFAQTTLVVDTQGDGVMVQDAGSGHDQIAALIDGGTVTLTGSVSSLAHKRLAELLAWWTQGTAAVNNQLTVSPPERDNDYEIQEAVSIAFERDPLVHAEQIQPRSADGVVILSGSVASDEERRVALADTWYIPGVLEVVDRIELHGDAPTHRPGAGASTRI